MTAPARERAGLALAPRAWRRSPILVATGVFLAQVAVLVAQPTLPCSCALGGGSSSRTPC